MASPCPRRRPTGYALDIVEGTSAISMHNIDTDAFGVHALQHYTSTYFAFEPRSFFDMAEITWVEGDEETAVKRLEEGGAVIVAREFKLAQGLGAGDTFTFKHDGKEYSLQIVGVVTSPGLELVSKFFNIGDDFVNQAVHGVFGTREDARKIFGTDAAQLIQVDLVDGVDDEEAIHRLREAVFGLGVLDAGSGRQIREQLELFVRGSLLVFSTIAVGSMLVACLGVANLIAAGIDARSYELGVLHRRGGAGGVDAARAGRGDADRARRLPSWNLHGHAGLDRGDAPLLEAARHRFHTQARRLGDPGCVRHRRGPHARGGGAGGDAAESQEAHRPARGDPRLTGCPGGGRGAILALCVSCSFARFLRA